MKLLDHEIKAVIFDMDGTLIDSTGIWHEIDVAFFAKRNMELPSDYAQHIVHLGLKQAAVYTKETHNLSESIQEIMDEWHQMSIDMYKYDVELKPGVKEVLDLLKTKGVTMSIATANDDSLYMPCINRLDLCKYFDFIADVNNVKEGKHSVRIYSYLCEKMGSKPENTLVLEDMPTCIKTCHDNGFITVAVYDDASKDFDNEKMSNSDLFINDMNELLSLLK
jgi:HAD superfamily hydrolase (TIGR01509 family)